MKMMKAMMKIMKIVLLNENFPQKTYGKRNKKKMIKINKNHNFEFLAKNTYC